MGWIFLIVRCAVVAIAILRGTGHYMRMYRNKELERLMHHTLEALSVELPPEQTCRNVSNTASNEHAVSAEEASSTAGFDAFLDWSSLLGIWRENSILYDEEDADLGVIVPAGQTTQDVGELLRQKFDQIDFPWPQQLSVSVQDGLVYVVPEYNRLHLDLYLVRYDASQSKLLPMWPSPTRTDSHAAATHGRPITGICTVQGLPCPANTESYLESLYGYLGSDAWYNPDTMLYEQKTSHEPDGDPPSLVMRVSKRITDFVHLLARDAYFTMVMLPIHESTRRFAESRYEVWVDKAVERICGKGRSFRDCF